MGNCLDDMMIDIYRGGFITTSYFIVYSNIIYFPGGDKRVYRTVNMYFTLGDIAL